MDNNSLKNASLFDNDPVLYAAWLYYQDGLSQSEVANIMSVSRVTVVKYLHLAREKGFVNISLDSSVFSTIDYSIRIKAKFNLNNVLILPDEEKNKSQQTSNMNRDAMCNSPPGYARFQFCFYAWPLYHQSPKISKLCRKSGSKRNRYSTARRGK